MDERIPSCDHCQLKMWAMLRKMWAIADDDPPCFQCAMPELIPDNFFPWKVLTVCASQLRVVGMGTPMGLEFSAIETAMDRVGIPEHDRDFVFDRVRRAGEAYAKLIRDRHEEDRRAADRKNNRSTTKSVAMFPPRLKQPGEVASEEESD